MSTAGKVFLVGCLLVLVLGFGGCMVLVGWLVDDPDGVEVDVEAPIQVLRGEDLEIVATVRNRGDERQELASVLLPAEYARGVAVQSSRPPFAESRVQSRGDVRFVFDLELGPGEERTIVLEAVAAHPGDYAGELDVCINNTVHCLSQVVRTLVVVPDGDSASGATGAAVPLEQPARIPPELPTTDSQEAPR